MNFLEPIELQDAGDQRSSDAQVSRVYRSLPSAAALLWLSMTLVYDVGGSREWPLSLVSGLNRLTVEYPIPGELGNCEITVISIFRSECRPPPHQRACRES